MKQLTGIDASFIHLERDKNKFQVGTLLFYDASTAKNSFVRFKDILKTFDSRIDKNSLLRKKLQMVPLSLDHPYWVKDPDFDIEDHVRHVALPKPGDWRQLCILVARLHDRPLDFARPLWEAYVIEGLDNVEGIPQGGFAIYFKLHHASIDGVGGNDLVTAIHDLVPFPRKSGNARQALSERIETKTESPGNVKMLARAYVNFLRQPGRVFDLVQTIGPAWSRLRKGKREKLFAPLGPSEHTRFNGHISGHMVLDAAIFDFAELREIKNAVEGITVNDVMLAIVSGAMQNYLSAKNETPVKDISAGVPINIRPFIEGAKETDSSNLVSVCKVSLKNTIKDPMDRLKAIHESAVASKAYTHAMGAKTMLEVSRVMPALLTSLAARALPALMTGGVPAVNLVVTNVPGSQVPLYMGGARLAGMCNIGILIEGMGLFHAVSSYCGTATVSFQACRKIMPDPEFYKECIVDSFNELKNAARASSKKRKPVAKAAPNAPRRAADKSAARASSKKTKPVAKASLRRAAAKIKR